MVLKSRGYVLKKLFIVLYTVQCTLVHAYVHIKKLSLRAAVVANRSITAATDVRSVDCSIIRHSRRFSSTEALSVFDVQCECCK